MIFGPTIPAGNWRPKDGIRTTQQAIAPMTRSDKTSMGGARSTFQTTHWSEIRNARTYDESRQRAIVDNLIRRYWKPIYCYLRRKGYDNDPAKDLTQGFFHEIVLGRHLIQQADEAKGRFRTFLLRTLDHYLISVHRAEVTAKRKPRERIVSLEDFDEDYLPSEDMKPDEAFTYAWASVLLDDVLAEVEKGCSRDNQESHWKVFRARVLDPLLKGTEPVPLGDLCKRFGIEGEQKASNMIVTVKRRFQAAMSSRVLQHVESDNEVEQEICDLIEILSRDRAR